MRRRSEEDVGRVQQKVRILAGIVKGVEEDNRKFTGADGLENS